MIVAVTQASHHRSAVLLPAVGEEDRRAADREQTCSFTQRSSRRDDRCCANEVIVSVFRHNSSEAENNDVVSRGFSDGNGGSAAALGVFIDDHRPAFSQPARFADAGGNRGENLPFKRAPLTN